jgi:uncharacterized RDD family membrane protein YckC
MTEGWGRPGDQYGDQYKNDAFPQPPSAPAWDQHVGGQTGHQPGPPSGEQPTQQWAQAPSDQSSPYGQQAPAYQDTPYAQQSPWGAPPPGFGGGPVVEYASWGARAGALILDGIFSLLVFIPGIAVIVGAGVSAETEDDVSGGLIAIGVLLMLAAVVVLFWNQGWRQGSVGWSWGKQVVGIKLVRGTDAQPPGGWLGIGRLLLRSLLGNVTAGIYTLLTYLWPLWDERHQSLDDKMLGTVVVRAR